MGLLPLLAGTLALQSAPALAQSYRRGPCASWSDSPRGPNDIIARAYGARLAETFGQAFIVENRTGAGAISRGSGGTRRARRLYDHARLDRPSAVNPRSTRSFPSTWCATSTCEPRCHSNSALACTLACLRGT